MAVLPGDSEVTLRLYNVEGKCLRTLAEGFQGEGYHGVRWDGKDAFGNTLSSGIYVYRLEVKSASHSFSESRKMFFVK